MSNTKELRKKINSIQNIKKITKVMEMIAASKMYKTKKRMLASKPYASTIYKMIQHISSSNFKYKHSYFVQRNIKAIGYFIIASDHGLAGSLNTNLFRKLISDISLWNDKKISVSLSIVGRKAISFFSFMKEKIVSYVSDIGDSPEISDLIGSIKVMQQLYDSESIDRLYLANNKFVTSVSQVPQILQILPIVSVKEKRLSNGWDYLYEPDSMMLLNILLQRYVEIQIYQGVIENVASEQSARMIAMQNASNNGDILIKDLKLFYNKVRQNKITQELIEIVSGASVI